MQTAILRQMVSIQKAQPVEISKGNEQPDQARDQAQARSKQLPLVSRGRHQSKCNSLRAHHPSGIAQQNGANYHVDLRAISVKLPDDLLARLAKHARAKRVTKSSLVREGLEKVLGEEQPKTGAVSCIDLARDRAGTIKGLPRDLARNPNYMGSFGE
jgi:Arc/MetJ-type ribon-helix-helix transcriptional regulator